jgi:hypothetical protein
MSRSVRLDFVVAALIALVAILPAGCPRPRAEPTATDGLAHLGWLPGTTMTYDAGEGLTETQEFRDSGVIVEDGAAVDVVARQNGFAAEERTMSLGADLEGISLLRLYSCLGRCGLLERPIAFLSWPLTTGDVVSGEAQVTETNGTLSTVRTEQHRTTVGASQSLTVPAGTFDAFTITWQRTTTPETGAPVVDSAVLYLAPETGIVKHETFAGQILELTDVTTAE